MAVHRKKLRTFENLETRYALAGNVTAAIDGSGNLLIEGDTLANGIIFNETSTGKFTLSGIYAGAAGTTINGGAANNTIQLNGVTGSITIRTADGSDNIQIPYFNYAGRFIINSGDGSDKISLGNATKSSYLVGTLSIRTNNGSDAVTEKNINVIGNQDCSATASNNGAEKSVRQSVTISDSTFGSFLSFDFGGRRASFTFNNSIAGGRFYVSNFVKEPLSLAQNQSWRDDEFFRTSTLTIANPSVPTKPIVVDEIFVFKMDHSSVGGEFRLDSSLTAVMQIDSSTIEGAKIRSLGNTNSLHIDQSYFGYLSTTGTHLYTISAMFNPVIFRLTKSIYDDVRISNSTANSLYIVSNGGISLTGIDAGTTTLSTPNNAHAHIEADGSVFSSLAIALGSSSEAGYASGVPTPSNTSQVVVAELTNCLVITTFSIDGHTRVQFAGRTLGIEGQVQNYYAYNAATAIYRFNSSSLGTVSTLHQDETLPINTPNVGTLGKNYFEFNNSVISAVNLLLQSSDDNVTFNNSSTSISTVVDGSLGTNVFINNGSLLANLQKKNFVN